MLINSSPPLLLKAVGHSNVEPQLRGLPLMEFYRLLNASILCFPNEPNGQGSEALFALKIEDPLRLDE